jgi:hypothetical protein
MDSPRFLRWWVALVAGLAAAALRAAEPAEYRSHSHNDYEQKAPLATALANRMGSVEADVWLIDGELRLGHSRDATRPGWTLRTGYLDPLKARVKERDGKIYRDGPPLVLLVDIKSEAAPTYAAIARELEADAALFTRFGTDGIKPGAITVIISGAVPRAKIGEPAQRLAACDGRPVDLEKAELPVALVPLVSDNWRNHFKWDGRGEMPAPEKEKLRAMAARCHAQGRKFRLWNAPDLPAAWREQLDAGVDYINTDNPAALHTFLSEHGLRG